MQTTKSPKELTLEQKILELLARMAEENGLSDLPVRLATLLIENKEIQTIQDYANNVSISRLGFNDHGPVHMRTVCLNALRMLNILHRAGIMTNLEKEGSGTLEDSIMAVTLASFLHDLGMTVGRQDHELYSGIIAFSLMDGLLQELFPAPEDLKRRVVIRSMGLEGIIGHMGTHRIHSLEAGIILIADGCDMTKGRARIPLEISSKPAVGDIHKYSANSIERVSIGSGAEKPIRIDVTMSSEVGFFQVEEVLIQKIQSSPARNLVELFAGVAGSEQKRYL